VRPRRSLTRAALLLSIAGAALAPRGARAQTFADEANIVEGEHPFRSPQRFAFELRFGPYRPDVDGEFNGARTPYKDFFGDDQHLLTQIEVDYEFFHAFGTLGVGLGFGYFSVTGDSPLADGSGQTSGDTSTLKMVPMSLMAVYRFDRLLVTRGFPLVPYGKLGLDYAYWQITDGNGEIATDGMGGRGRGGTFGWHAAAGLALVLDMFDPEAARDFDSDLGVNHTALVFELSHADISGLGQANRLHLGDTTWSLGILIQF
jgi:hypothetical protein